MPPSVPFRPGPGAPVQDVSQMLGMLVQQVWGPPSVCRVPQRQPTHRPTHPSSKCSGIPPLVFPVAVLPALPAETTRFPPGKLWGCWYLPTSRYRPSARQVDHWKRNWHFGWMAIVSRDYFLVPVVLPCSRKSHCHSHFLCMFMSLSKDHWIFWGGCYFGSLCLRNRVP